MLHQQLNSDLGPSTSFDPVQKQEAVSASVGKLAKLKREHVSAGESNSFKTDETNSFMLVSVLLKKFKILIALVK
jgi:hypothetical protein